MGFYIDNGRVHVGAEETAADMAYDAWAADLDAGRDSMLLAPTNDIVDTLNARARLDRLAAADPGACTVTKFCSPTGCTPPPVTSSAPATTHAICGCDAPTLSATATDSKSSKPLTTPASRPSIWAPAGWCTSPPTTSRTK